MMENLIEMYTFLFGTKGAVDHMVKDMLAFMTEHPSYTPDELYVALKTKPVTPPAPPTLLGLPIVVDSAVQMGQMGDIVFGPPHYRK